MATKGFWTKTDEGREIHILGEPDIDPATVDALRALADAASHQYARIAEAFGLYWQGIGPRRKAALAQHEKELQHAFEAGYLAAVQFQNRGLTNVQADEGTTEGG